MDYELQDLLSYLFEGVYVVDQHRKIVFWNSGSERITGYKASEVVNKNCYSNILKHVDKNGKELCFGGCPLHETLKTGKILENDVFLHHKDGHRIPVTVKTLPLKDDNDNIIAAIEVFTDSRYNKEHYTENRDLKELLSFDQLTKIPNRRYIEFILDNLVKENKKFETTFGAMFIDIDDFKLINDEFGHGVGDDVLKLVSNTLNANIRGDDHIGRWGGEEFLGVFKLQGKAELMLIAEKLRMLVEKSYIKVEGKEISVTISIGATMFIKNENIDNTISRADKAMYDSKATGKNKTTIK